MSSMRDDIAYIECACYDCEHVIRIQRDSIDKEVYVEICINPYQPFWKRVYSAILFILGMAHRYCSFDTFIINDEQREKLIKYLDQPWPEQTNLKGEPYGNTDKDNGSAVS